MLFRSPFSYFTQITYFAFIRRIKKEKKQLYIKYVSLQNGKQLFDLNLGDYKGYLAPPGKENEFDRFVTDYITTYEESAGQKQQKRERKKKVNKKATLLVEDE